MEVVQGDISITIENVDLQNTDNDTLIFLGMQFMEEPELGGALPTPVVGDEGIQEVNWGNRQEFRQEANDQNLSTRQSIEQYGHYDETYSPLVNAWVSGYTATREPTEETIVITDMPTGSSYPFAVIDGGPGKSTIVDQTESGVTGEFGLRITDNWQTPEFVSTTPQVYDQQEWESRGGDQPQPVGDNDVLQGNERRTWLMSSYGNDTLIGGSDADFLQSGFSRYPNPDVRGTQLIRDWVDASELNESRDKLYGGGGNDILMADADDNELYGDDGEDVLFGGADSDRLFGGDDRDYLNGDVYFRQTEQGGAGRITIGADPANEAVKAGKDHLEGGEGNDDLLGGAGDDRLYGQADDDRLYGDEPGIVHGTLLEMNEAHHGNDHLFGGEGSDTILGNGGNDIALGGVGNDFLYGDSVAGDQRLDVQYHGEDTLFGGADNDVVFGDGKEDELHGGEGNDTLVGDDLADSDRLDVADHADDTLFGDSGNDFLLGSGGDDTLYGGTGNDSLYGYDDESEDASDTTVSDNDTLIGGSGNDWLYGQGGDDTYEFNRGDGRDTIEDSGGSGDRVKLGVVSDGASFLRFGGNLYMSSGGDQLSVKDYFTSNSIEQFEFADGVTFDGFTVQESIFSFGGGAGVDVLTGNSRSTRFEGKEGNDTIRPGGGDDSIDGGEGRRGRYSNFCRQAR
jgi:Ca2+-binding RTX toxin-like protein